MFEAKIDIISDVNLYYLFIQLFRKNWFNKTLNDDKMEHFTIKLLIFVFIDGKIQWTTSCWKISVCFSSTSKQYWQPVYRHQIWGESCIYLLLEFWNLKKKYFVEVIIKLLIDKLDMRVDTLVFATYRVCLNCKLWIKYTGITSRLLNHSVSLLSTCNCRSYSVMCHLQFLKRDQMYMPHSMLIICWFNALKCLYQVFKVLLSKTHRIIYYQW